MKSVLSFIILIGIISIGLFPIQKSFSQNSTDNKLAFEGAMGWAATTQGGRGGKIIKVTTLKKEGDGSLKEAIETNEPRIIVFEVGGIIDLEMTSIIIKNPYMTIIGQTAPDPGITIIKGGMSIQTHEIILQHIRIRPGENNQAKKSGWEVDGISTSGAHHVIIDHCSFSWATDENLSASGPRFEGANVDEWRMNTSHTVTFSNNIIAEGLSNSSHAKGEHSKGSLIHDNTTEIAIITNIFASNVRRSPFFKGGAQGVIVNNYIYNPGFRAIHYNLSNQEWDGHEWVTGKMTVIGNVLEKGMDSHKHLPYGQFHGPVDIYWDDNQVLGEQIKDDRILIGDHSLIDTKPVWPLHLEVISSDSVKAHLLEKAGARPWNRDEVDIRIIQEIKEGKNRIIDSEQEVGGYPKALPTFKKFDASGWDIENLIKK